MDIFLCSTIHRNPLCSRQKIVVSRWKMLSSCTHRDDGEFVLTGSDVWETMESKKMMKELMESHLKTSHEIEDILRSYLFILHQQKDLLQKAILLLDDIEIIKIESQTTLRHFWMVNDFNRRSTYRVLDCYCPCRDYFDQIQRFGSEDAFCPHLIAISLGTSLKKIESRSFGNEDFVKMLSEC
jgi:predicted nucleic acid-binding Zn finger protein